LYCWRPASLILFAALSCLSPLEENQSNAGYFSIFLNTSESEVRKPLISLWRALGVGRAGFSALMSSVLQITSRVPSTLFLPGPWFLSCTTMHIFPKCSCTLSANFLARFASALWVSLRLGKGKNTQAGKSDHKVSAKAAARASIPNQFSHLQGLLPAWSY
jgi:hypothetical protein